jgi:hypothetical protein
MLGYRKIFKTVRIPQINRQIKVIIFRICYTVFRIATAVVATRYKRANSSTFVHHFCRNCKNWYIREVSHQYENDNDNEHVITLWVCASNHDVISRHFVQINSWRSKQTWFCWFASICGHFPLANAVRFDYLKTNWWRVRDRIRTGAKSHYYSVLHWNSTPSKAEN